MANLCTSDTPCVTDFLLQGDVNIDANFFFTEETDEEEEEDDWEDGAEALIDNASKLAGHIAISAGWHCHLFWYLLLSEQTHMSYRLKMTSM